MDGQIITFLTDDGLGLKGYLTKSVGNFATIIHIHGSCGNFYENSFIPIMAHVYTSNGINFLSVNNRGHDCISEAYKRGNLVYIGGSQEIIEECVLDIKGAIKYAEQLGSRIIIQGHSFGCQKVLYYLSTTTSNIDFILLSPADTYRLQTRYIFPRSVDEQIIFLREKYDGHMDDLLSPDEFGVRQQGTDYFIPITPKSLINTLKSPVIRSLNYEEPLDYFIKASAFIYYGGKDPLWTEPREIVETFFLKRVQRLNFYYCKQGDHHFHGFENIVAKQIVNWTKQAET